MMIEVKKTNCDWSFEDSGDLTKHCYVTMISYIVLQGLVKLRYAKLLASLYIISHDNMCCWHFLLYMNLRSSQHTRCIHLQVATTSVNKQCLHIKHNGHRLQAIYCLSFTHFLTFPQFTKLK